MNVPVFSEYENSRYLSHCEQRNFLAIFNHDGDDDDDDDDDDKRMPLVRLKFGQHLVQTELSLRACTKLTNSPPPSVLKQSCPGNNDFFKTKKC